MKKRTMSLILSTALMLSVGLTACSNGDEKTGTDNIYDSRVGSSE